MEPKLASLFGPTAVCMPIDELVMNLDQPEGSEMRRNCEQHIASCAYCSSELALFRQFESAQPASGEREVVGAIVSRLRKDSPAASEPWWSKIWKPSILAPAALALAAASVAIVLNVNPRVDRLETPVDNIVRSSKVSAIAPIGDLAAAPSQLRWQAVAGATRYRVHLLEVDRTGVWDATVDSTSVEIPRDVRARITPLKRLLWEVGALDSSGNAIASSGLQSFVVKK